MGFFGNSYRVVAMDKQFNPFYDKKLKNPVLPRIDEMVLLEGEYYQVVNTIYSFDDRVIWIIVEPYNFARTENSGQNE